MRVRRAQRFDIERDCGRLLRELRAVDLERAALVRRSCSLVGFPWHGHEPDRLVLTEGNRA
jgi:hypothetical protein